MSHRTLKAGFCRRALILAAAVSISGFVFVRIPGTDSFVAHAQTSNGGTRLLRTPTVSATQIAFAYAQNIWVVPRAGGMARRVTSFQGQTSNPHFSPDGKWIAFSGEYAGNLDVYVVAADGGEPKRLTWHPGADSVQGWTPDGKAIMFSTSRATWSPSGAPRFWTVPAEGGVEEPLPLPRGYQGKISADGSHIAYRMNNSWDEERRNYRGGQNRPIWIVDLKTYDLISPPWTDSKDMDPVWAGESVYFISDRDGVANVWAYETRSKKLTQVTRFTDFDVKTMDSGGGAVVFEQAGYLHELDPKSGKEHVVNITATGDFPWMMPRWEDVTSRITNMGISPTGKRVVVEARGEIFTIPSEKGDVRNLTNSSGSAERDPAWSPDGKSISYFSDKSGEYRLYIEAQDGLTPPREITLDHPTHYYTSSWSPDSKKILFSDTNLHVWVVDVATGKAKIVGNDPWMVPTRTLNPVWSPDSKWVAYSSRLRSMYHAIFVSNVETGESKQVTDGLADAVWPVWDAGGKYLWFLASTDFGLRSQWLDMTSYDHDENFGLYLAVLKKSDSSPLLPESDEDRGVGTGRRTLPGRRLRWAMPTPGPPDATAGEQPPRHRAVRANPSACKSILMDCASASSRFPACLNGSTQSCIQAPTELFTTSKRRRAGKAAVVAAWWGGSELIRYRLCDRSGAIRCRGHSLTKSAQTVASSSIARPAAVAAGGGRGRVAHRRLHLSLSLTQIERRPSRARAASTSTCACISIPRKNSNRSSTKAGATSAIISMCRTCTAPTGRRTKRCTGRCCPT